MDQERIVALIMAGGGGTRFWPRSRRSQPKQFLSFDGSESLLSLAVGRLGGLVKPEQTLIVTGRDHVSLAQKHSGLPESSIVGEPLLRDTAACVGLGALHARRLREDAVVAVLPADHLIEPKDRFQHVLKRAAELASSSPSLVTIGLRPDRPATGYGYIEIGETVDDAQPPGCKIIRFREKPDLETARRFVMAGRFLWNSGMLVFETDTLLAALEEHLPELHSGLMSIKDLDDQAEVAKVYETLPRISIDFGVLEPARNTLVVEAALDWDDVGTFEAVARRAARDEQGNQRRGEAEFLDATGNLVENDTEGLVVISGVSDLLVVRTRDAVLVLPRKDSQRVKDVVRHLEERGMSEYL